MSNKTLLKIVPPSECPVTTQRLAQKICELQKQKMTLVFQITQATLGQPSYQGPNISVGSRPRDLNAFGFGNVRTGQVTSTKLAFLTRASSVGAEKRERLGGGGVRASPMHVPASPAAKPKHWPLPPAANSRPGNQANRYHT